MSKTLSDSHIVDIQLWCTALGDQAQHGDVCFQEEHHYLCAHFHFQGLFIKEIAYCKRCILRKGQNKKPFRNAAFFILLLRDHSVLNILFYYATSLLYSLFLGVLSILVLDSL